ncbi:MAG: methionyl-tRNA formyltransferase [Acetobacteraceae bacterium]|nr:methionyl-tRNA formyltransferase [Acetobacteraceae bacterium]
MRLAFMGSPGFAVPTLRALVEAGHEIVAVYAQPPRPVGRGGRVQKGAVHQEADRLGLPVRTPASLRRDPAAQAAFAALALDAAVVAAYGLLLPAAVLAAPRRGCLNVHASLLPRWRGAAPIQAAILAGDHESGVTIMQMDEGLDTGPMLLREAVPLGPRATAAWLHDRLADLGACLVVRALAEAPLPLPQPAKEATYAPKLIRESGRLDWTRPAIMLDRQVRALNPRPGTFTTLDKEMLKVLDAVPEPGRGEPGEVLDSAFLVACGEGALRLLRVQRPGRAPMGAAEMLRGRPVARGTLLR